MKNVVLYTIINLKRYYYLRENNLILNRNDIIFDKSMGIELEIADNILIRYEAIVKMINDGRKSTC